MPTDPIPAGHPAGLDVCNWPVSSTRSHGWKCNAVRFHDYEHRLIMGGRIVARSEGFTHPEVPPLGQAER